MAKELQDDTKSNAISDSSMKFENLRFQEEWSRNFQHDYQPIVQQKIFKFKYREALGTAEDHLRRESRMFARLTENFERLQAKYDEYAESEQQEGELESSSRIDVLAKEKAFYDELFRFNIQNYKNYFESDDEADMTLIEDIPNEARVDIIDGMYLDEMNKYSDKLQLKGVTIGKIKGDYEGLVGTILDVYKFTQKALPALQNRIDLYNIDEKSHQTVQRIHDKQKAEVEGQKAQIADKSEDK